jgi:hypothetical protein
MTRFVFRTLLAVALGCVLSLSGAVMHTAPHRLKIPLDAIHADRECIDQVEALGVLGQDRREDTK